MKETSSYLKIFAAWLSVFVFTVLNSAAVSASGSAGTSGGVTPTPTVPSCTGPVQSGPTAFGFACGTQVVYDDCTGTTTSSDYGACCTQSPVWTTCDSLVTVPDTFGFCSGGGCAVGTCSYYAAGGTCTSTDCYGVTNTWVLPGNGGMSCSCPSCSSGSGGSAGSSTSSSGFSCGGAVAGLACTPDVICIGCPSSPVAFPVTVTLTVTDTSWSSTGQVDEGKFVGGAWVGPVVQNFFTHDETSAPQTPSFAMRQIDSSTAPGYPYAFDDGTSSSVDYDHVSGVVGIPFALNPVKNSTGANVNVDGSNHYSYSMTFTLNQTTRFSIKGFPVLAGGTLESLTIIPSFSGPTGPIVSGTLKTADVPTDTTQVLFNTGDTVRLDWNILFQ